MLTQAGYGARVRARAPRIEVGARHLTVRTELEADGRTGAPPLEVPALEVMVPIEHADLLDPTALPGAHALAIVAAARGEDLVVEGPVDEVAVDGIAEVARLLSTWWGTGPIRVTVADPVAVEPAVEDGVALFFTRGVDSWSTLLDLLDRPPPDRVTHLLTVHHAPPEVLRPVEVEHVHRHRAVAAELGLPLVVLETNLRRLVDPYRTWLQTVGPALVATGLQAGARFRRLVVSGAHTSDVHTRTGADPDLVTAIRTTRTEVVLGNPDRDRDQRVAHLLTSPLARRTLHVCWEGAGAGNCGRCRKCQVTMASLLLAGDPDPSAGFDAPIDPELFAAMAIGPELATFVLGMVADLPASEEHLRRAIASSWDRNRGATGPARLGDDAPPALAGPPVATRVAAARRATTGHPEAPTAVPLGWTRAEVPLRPAHDDHDEVRARAATATDRPRPWAVAEPRDPHQADLARALATHHGPGVVALPVLDAGAADAGAVSALLGTARTRLWWRDAGGLDPLRVVESIEHGCLPLQLMPPAAAARLRADLPPALAALVVADDEVPALDLGPAAVVTRLAPALDHLLAGSAEHDLLAGAYR